MPRFQSNSHRHLRLLKSWNMGAGTCWCLLACRGHRWFRWNGAKVTHHDGTVTGIHILLDDGECTEDIINIWNGLQFRHTLVSQSPFRSHISHLVFWMSRVISFYRMQWTGKMLFVWKHLSKWGNTICRDMIFSQPANARINESTEIIIL
jgi:hypothetical protein